MSHQPGDEIKKHLEEMDAEDRQRMEAILSKVGRSAEEQIALSNRMVKDCWDGIDRHGHEMLKRYADQVGYTPIIASLSAAMQVMTEKATEDFDEESKAQVELTTSLMYHTFMGNEANANVIREEIKKRAEQHFRENYGGDAD